MSTNNVWIPMQEVESAYGTREVSLRTRLYGERVIIIDGEITSETLDSVAMQAMMLAKSDEPVRLLINSGGGQVQAGLGIYDILQDLQKTRVVDYYCYGLAASMAAVIFSGGKKGHRFLLPHSEMMIHEPLIQNGLGGSASSISRTAESILGTKKLLNEILAEHTGKTVDEINVAIEHDNYMKADEAIKFGLADEVRGLLA